MAERLQIPIPMWRVHWHLLGGARRQGLILFIVLLAEVGGFIVMRRLMYDSTMLSVCSMAIAFMTFGQIGLLVIGGCNAIYRAMLRDFESRMLESHRLTPMTNSAVVLGYLFGATQQMLLLFALSLAVGAVISAIGKLSVLDWVIGNLVFLSGSLLLWSMVIFACLRPAKPLNPMPFVVAVGALANVALAIVPGLGMFSALYIFILGSGRISSWIVVDPAALILVVLLGLLITVFWLFVAASKYRRPDLPALNGMRGGLLLALWLAIGGIGIFAFLQYVGAAKSATGQAIMRRGELLEVAPFQWMSTAWIAYLIAAQAISGAVECRRLLACGTAARGWSDRLNDLMVALCAGALIAAVLTPIGSSFWHLLREARAAEGYVGVPMADRIRLGATVAACLLAPLIARGLFATIYPIWPRGKVIAAIVLVTLFAVPPLVDTIRAGALEESPSWLMGCSPAGTVAVCGGDLGEVNVLPGLGVQALVAIVLSVTARLVGSAALRTPALAPTAVIDASTSPSSDTADASATIATPDGPTTGPPS